MSISSMVFHTVQWGRVGEKQPCTNKIDKYTDLETDLKEKGWTVHLVPFEVSSRGQILKHTQLHIFNTLKHFKIKFRTQQKLIKNLSKISLLCTFAVFHAFQTKEWIDPLFLKP